MSYRRSQLLAALAALTLLTGGLSAAWAAEKPAMEQVLVGFEAETDVEAFRQAGGEVKYVFHLVPVIAGRLPAGAIEKLAAQPGVAYIEPDARAMAIQDLFEGPVPGDFIPWGVAEAGANSAVAAGPDGRGVKVALLDTGLDYRHPDLAPNFRGGYDFANDDPDPMDDHGHGTHCAGIIAAAADGQGVVGIAPRASLYAVKVMDRRGKAYYSDVIAGLQWAADHRMDIANLSLGSYEPSRALRAACTAAHERGLLLVAASGNDGGPVMVPARYPSVVAVSAVDVNGEAPAWSNVGREIEFAAPGENIISTVRGGYAAFWGTSMAAPHVTGAAALVMSSPVGDADRNASGRWDPDEVRARLAERARDLGAPGRDPMYGYGFVDARGALKASPIGPQVEVVDIRAPEACRQGEPVRVSVELANLGDKPADLDIVLWDTTYGTPLDSQRTRLAAGERATLTFTCATDEAAPGKHLLAAEAHDANGAVAARSLAAEVTVGG